jgi:uncharacterized protein (DUF58 family)
MVHTARNLAQLVVSPGRAEPVFAGEAAQFRLLLENPVAVRPALDPRAPCRLGRPTGRRRRRRLAGRSVLAVPAARRGRLALGRVMLETRFPLDLFRAWSYVEPDAHCLIYPHPVYSALPVSGAQVQGGTARAPTRGNDDFSGCVTIRRRIPSPHRLEDGCAHRQPADEAVLRRYSEELWLEWQRVNPALGLEERLSVLAGWVLAAEQSGARYGLRIPGIEIAPGRGDAQRAECLQALALYPRAMSTPHPLAPKRVFSARTTSQD